MSLNILLSIREYSAAIDMLLHIIDRFVFSGFIFLIRHIRSIAFMLSASPTIAYIVSVGIIAISPTLSRMEMSRSCFSVALPFHIFIMFMVVGFRFFVEFVDAKMENICYFCK